MEKEKRFQVCHIVFILVIGTEHEVFDESIEVEEITTVLDNTAMLISAGRVSQILENSYIIDAGHFAKYSLFS